MRNMKNKSNNDTTDRQAPKFTLEMIMEQATALQELLPIRMRWEPVEKILALNGIQLMLRVIAYSYEWSFSGR